MISNESECGVVHSLATAIVREDAETRSGQVNHSRGVMSLGLRTRILLHTFSDRGAWEVHRQLTGLVPLYPGGVSGSVNIYLSSLQ